MGTHLIRKLLGDGYFIRNFDRIPAAKIEGQSASLENYEYFEGDIMSEESLHEAMSDCDVCVHLASTTLPRSSNADPLYDIESNLLGTVKLLQQAVKAKIRKIIFVSSGGTVYGVSQQEKISESHPTDPITSYGIIKLAIEKYLALFQQLYGLEYMALRVSNPYGPGQPSHRNQGAATTFLKKALRGEEIEIWGDGSIRRDYIYIDDLISALASSVTYRGEHRVLNIGSGTGVSLNELLDKVDEVVGRKSRRKYVAGRAFDVPVNVLDIRRAKEELAWEPRVSLEKGLGKYADWMRGEGHA